MTRQAAAELGNTDVGVDADADAAPGFDAGEAAAAAVAAATQPEREVHSFEIDPAQARRPSALAVCTPSNRSRGTKPRHVSTCCCGR